MAGFNKEGEERNLVLLAGVSSCELELVVFSITRATGSPGADTAPTEFMISI
jgi:hypothetical protein